MIFQIGCGKKKVDNSNSQNDTETEATKLVAPRNIGYNKKTYEIGWNRVEGAIGYEVIYDGNVVQTVDNKLNILFLFDTDKEINVEIASLSDNPNYNSNYSNTITVKLSSTEGLGYTYNEELDGYSVSLGRYSLKSLPETLIIPDYYLGRPVYEIAEYGFANKSLYETNIDCPVKRIRLPKHLIKINDHGLNGTRKVEQILLPDKLEYIGTFVLNNATNLENINLPKSLKFLGECAFSYAGLKEINVPNIIDEWTMGLFEGCNKLEKVTFEEGIEIIPFNFFRNCSNLKDVILPNTLKEISDGAFRNCTSLEKITIPESVDKMGLYIFNSCSNLKEIVLPPIDIIDSSCFTGTMWFNDYCNSMGEIVTYKASFWGLNNISENFDLVIPDNITYISQDSLIKQKNLRSVYIPSSVTFIPENAFKECENLIYAEIDANITSIPKQCFNKCYNLKEVKLSDTIEIFSSGCFSNCTSLETINTPKNLHMVSSDVFYNTLMLKFFDFSEVSSLCSLSLVGFEFIKLNVKEKTSGSLFSIGGQYLKTIIIGKDSSVLPYIKPTVPLDKIFYEGSKDNFDKLLADNFDSNELESSGYLTRTIYYYSEDKPITEGNYWHYVNEEIVIWE